MEWSGVRSTGTLLTSVDAPVVLLLSRAAGVCQPWAAQSAVLTAPGAAAASAVPGGAPHLCLGAQLITMRMVAG